MQKHLAIGRGVKILDQKNWGGGGVQLSNTKPPARDSSCNKSRGLPAGGCSLDMMILSV